MLNKVILDARLARDVELRYTQGGEAIATLNLANSEKTKKKDGSSYEKVVFVECKLFGRIAEVANQYLKKGSRVLIEGKLNLETWEKNGVKHYKHNVLGTGLTMLDSNPQTQAQLKVKEASRVEEVSFNPPSSAESYYANSPTPLPEIEVNDDIPF